MRHGVYRVNPERIVPRVLEVKKGDGFGLDGKRRTYKNTLKPSI